MKVNAKKIAGVGLLTALVVVLQLLGSFIKFGTVSISLVLIPIVVGAALYGVGAGAWLGGVFAVVVLCQPDTALFLNMSIFGTNFNGDAQGHFGRGIVWAGVSGAKQEA